jgi:hypothetical protein
VILGCPCLLTASQQQVAEQDLVLVLNKQESLWLILQSRPLTV